MSSWCDLFLSCRNRRLLAKYFPAIIICPPLLRAEAQDKLRRVDHMTVTANPGENETVRHSSAVGIDQESIDRDAERRVMVKTSPSSSFEVTEPDLLLELLVIALDAPAQLGVVDQPTEADVVWKRREPVLGRLLLALRPFDQQPFFR